MSEAGSGQGGESLVTVLVAFAANLAIAIAKTVAALLTASASMFAEALHSWADAGNEVFLYIAGKRAQKPPDGAHPLGYGRDSYVWSMFAAVGLFTVGAVVSIQHGISELTSKGPAEEVLVNYIVLGVSFVLEGVSFVRALSQVRGAASAADRELLSYTLNTSDPTVRAVFFEDLAALVGIVIAAIGITLHELTGVALWDAAGSIAVGLVLGVVAVILIQQNRRFLIGEAVDPKILRAALAMLTERPDIKGVTYLHLEYVGPGSVFLVAAVDLEGDERESDVAQSLRRIAEELQQRPHVLRAVLTLSVPGEPVVAL
ncbi:cation diffusion facilitator family transporter [Amnibacterium sp. CER49]|uniref:cation diffusion facilitator family transporter n=1 Tax=Amnibacterium sp. CER49 TaxID=3039161 RepID=UPI0024490FBB|nr:cation diffusion facilitator family transporter [Amnibacterium sp. CER49]MDH2444468.1 cation diffusion facilitator family transporter [Amnibacterium sp. CER49]